MGADIRLEERLAAVLRPDSRLRLALLFGSAARGALREGSDVDVAVLPVDPDLALADELDLQAALARACGREVDLVRLDQAATLLKWQVVLHGRLIVSRGPFDLPRFVASATCEYLDFAPALRRAQARFRRRLAAGGRGAA